MPSYKKWGPKKWKEIHTFTLNYPETPSENYKKKAIHYILSFPHTLPCKECETNTTNFLSQFNYEDLYKICSSKELLILFFFNYHNKVNQRLGKKIMSLEDFLNYYL